MFFRHKKQHVDTFSELMDHLRQQGFTVQPEPGGGIRAGKGGCAAVVAEGPAGHPRVAKAGIFLGKEVAVLVDAGYQKFWLAPSGHRAAATAGQLHSLHGFEEDLREALGLVSLYNESLGSTNELHLYDRVKDRDQGVPKRAWEK
ncbi:MAG TPA: hypothetical protein VM120_16325 [Bryobacteraceae bacterium]|nr:hypothetical protein [Bryobacteraceae bacterium]